MVRELIMFGDDGAPMHRTIGIEATRLSARRIALDFRVRGAISDIYLPPLAPQERGHELWRSTCFEAFFRRPDDMAYLEINLSPSGRWASYAFEAYRSGMRDDNHVIAESIAIVAGQDSLSLSAVIDFGSGHWLADGELFAGFSAIIQDNSGQTACWALTHPAEKPDFHHAGSFVAILPAPAQP